MLREIKRHQHVIARRHFLESGFAKDFFIKLFAPSTPVRSGEINQQGLFLFGGSFFGSFPVRHPAFAGSKQGRRKTTNEGGHGEGGAQAAKG